MSDESLMQPNFKDECEERAPTDVAPIRSSSGPPVRGVALSVLWWLEGDGARASAQG